MNGLLAKILQQVKLLVFQSTIKIVDAIIFEARTYTRDMIFKSLKIGRAGYVNAAGYDIVVFGDLTIRSARLTCKNLYVFGNINVSPEVGSTYLNILEVENLYCSGNCSVTKAWYGNDSNILAWSKAIIGGDFYESDTGLNGWASDSVQSAGGLNRALYVGGNYTKIFTSATAYWDAMDAAGRNRSIRVNGSILISASTLFIRIGGGGYASIFLISCGGNLTLSGTVKPDDINTLSVFTVRYGGTKTGSFDYSSWSQAPAGNHTETNSIGTLHAPNKPVATTADGAGTSSLVWNVPSDINSDTLQFRVEIEEKYDDLSYIKVIDQTSLSDPARFSGTKPYPAGTGSVTYTIPAATLTSGKTYRWRVTAQKNADATVTSLPSEWRAFVYA